MSLKYGFASNAECNKKDFKELLTPCGKVKNILLRNNPARLSYLLFPLLIFDSKGHYKYM